MSEDDLRSDSDRILTAVASGERFVVTRGGEPVGELRPLGRRHFVPAEAVVEMFRAAPSVAYSELADDLDRIVDQDLGHQ